MINNTSCPLCGAKDFIPFRINLLKCTTCALVIDSNVWRDTANEEFEEQWFGENYNCQLSIWEKLFERWNNQRTWQRIDKAVSLGGKLLEIGVGSGSFLNFAKTKGLTVSGCDLSQSICKRIKDIYSIPMHCGYVSELPTDISYDFVIMNHVLEHTNRPVEFLCDVCLKMRLNGLLHIAVPNVNCWEAKLPGWNSYEPYHLVYFTAKTLSKAVEKAGFKIISCTTHESFSGWFLAILRTLLKSRIGDANERYAQKQALTNSWIENAYRLTMFASGGLSLPLCFIQNRLGYGDELIIIATRPAL
jgi:2-polyprenyl-3-methyl-5-hydroxy-6-metoxy-1,4-benzoquinol methylase